MAKGSAELSEFAPTKFEPTIDAGAAKLSAPWRNPHGDREQALPSQPRKPYTGSDIKMLKAHSKARAPVPKLSKMMKRSEGSLRQKALLLGIGLGHQR
jgi:hypothetical protein